MGSGNWFKNIIRKKKSKGGDTSQKLKRHSAPGNITAPCSENQCPLADEQSSQKLSLQNTAATRIQAAYRAYSARKNFRRTKGMRRLQNLVECDSVKKQASTTLSYLHSWNKIQAQIRARRAHMVTEGRLRQKKMEDQLKLEAKLHDLEVAALKRERAMAYAFSHQWRSNTNAKNGLGNDELGKTNWGWSWADRWVSAQPWERRASACESPKKTNGTNPSRKTAGNKKTNISSPANKATPGKPKSASPKGKVVKRKGRRLSFEAAEKKGDRRVSPLAEEKRIKNGSKEGLS